MKEHGRLLYWTYSEDDSVVDWESFENVAEGIIGMILEFRGAFAGDVLARDMAKKANVIVPRRPAKGNIMARAMKQIAGWLRESDTVVDEVKGRTGDLKIYQLFDRKEYDSAVEHKPRELLVFDKEQESIDYSKTTATAETVQRIDNALEYVKEYVEKGDVASLARRAFAAGGGINISAFGTKAFIITPELYDLFDGVSLMLETIGLVIGHFKLDREDGIKLDGMIRDALIDEVVSVVDEVSASVEGLRQKKNISDRLYILEGLKTKVAVYSAILGDVQGALSNQLSQAELLVAKKLEEVTAE